MLRRTFLQTIPAATVAVSSSSSAGQAAARGEGIRLGYDTYSVRAFHWKDIRLLDYAAELKLNGIQISGLDDYESLEPSHLAAVKEHARRLGITIDAGIGCICPTTSSWNPKTGDPAQYIVKGLQIAKAVGAGVMRCYMGSSADRLSRPIEEHMEATIKVFRSVRSPALDSGVKIALENHSGDLQAREVKTIIEESGKDFVGSCLDAGNPIWAVEDPLVTLETLGPYVLTTHVRDSVVYEHPRGAAGQWVALGDGIIDFHRFVARFKELCPKASIQLEIITGRPPRVLPYLEPDFWKAFPNANAAEFARFVALAKSGHPFMGTMIIADAPGPEPAEYEAALKEQQRVDLERSVAYAHTTLNL